MSEDEAADFWSTHAMSEELLEDSILEEKIYLKLSICSNSAAAADLVFVEQLQKTAPFAFKAKEPFFVFRRISRNKWAMQQK